MTGIFDSHAHYDDERFDQDREEVLEATHRGGVEWIMNIGLRPAHQPDVGGAGGET